MRPLRAADPDPGLAAPPGGPGPFRLGRGAIDDVRAALSMLTRLPVPSTGTRTGTRAYAIVGGLLGVAAFVPLWVLGPAIPVVVALLAVAILATLSGGLHLDGLADTFDALVALGPNAAERARRDPAVGAGGATALIVVLGIDVAAIAELVTASGVAVAGFACVAAGAVSRVVPVVLARIAPTTARDGGLGGWFVRRTSIADAAIAVTTGLAILVAGGLVVAQPELALAAGAAGAGSVGLGVAVVRVRGQLDGDGLGAAVELSVATTLIAMAVVAAGLPS
jgi:adenosylcobinamide-GDP ribazoletransferase